MSLKRTEIAQKMHKRYKNMGNYTVYDQQNYLQGMSDILDALSAVHPELLSDMFSIRHEVEDLIEEEEENNG